MTTYTLHTPASPDRALEAWSLGELAELIGCAIAAGDAIEHLVAHEAGRIRFLTSSELEWVLAELGAG